MLDVSLPIDFRLAPVFVAVRSLTELQVGEVLALNYPVTQPAVLLVAGADGLRAPGAETPGPRGGALMYEEPKYLTGGIYAPDSNGLLFKFNV